MKFLAQYRGRDIVTPAEAIVVRRTFFYSAATCLHVPARLTRESPKPEGRKPRASDRHVVGCCEVLAGSCQGLKDVDELGRDCE